MLESLQWIFRGGIRLEHPVDASLIAHQEINVSTNGTTAVNVFGPKGAPFKGTITTYELTALDTTAGNITLAVNGNVVSTIAKGVTAGGLGGPTAALANVSFNPGDKVTIVSSSAGNALCWIAYFSASV